MQKKIIEAKSSRYEKWQPSANGSMWSTIDSCIAHESDNTFVEMNPSENQIQSSLEEYKRMIYKKTYDEAFELGRLDGANAGQEEMKKQFQALKNIYKTLSLYESMIDEHVCKEIGSLALSMAKRIVEKEISNDGDYVLNLIETGLKKLPKHDGSIQVLMSPKDFEFVQEGLEKIEHALIEFLVDESLSIGDVVIKTNDSLIDATLQRRFLNLIEILEGDDA